MIETLRDILVHYPEISGVHPACLAVPEISDDDREKLEQDIASKGLLEDILLTASGELLDGRNRLMACYRGNVEPRFTKTSSDPWDVAFSRNIARRHLSTKQLAVFGLAWVEHEKQQAKKRMEARKGNQPGANNSGNLSLVDPGQSRDKVGERVGTSGRSIDKIAAVAEHAPEKLKDDSTLEEAYKEAQKVKRQKAALPIENPSPPSENLVPIITAKGKESLIPMPKKVVFNQTNDSVDWASWTWNPVTGCEHGCKFCYAREIAHSERMADYYPNKFEPTYHGYRLAAPRNTSKPESSDPRDGRVFVCSMADLFGKWVPDAWIESVFDACLKSPHWEYLFLTKWPARYSRMPLIENAWYGASVIQQSDVKRVEADMQKIASGKVIRWISLEPMLEPIRFDDIGWCDLVVIGSQTSTNQPDGRVEEFAPEFDWVFDVVAQCKQAGVPYYLKENLGLSRPGMKLPKGLPRGYSK
jgi:protein gp37